MIEVAHKVIKEDMSVRALEMYIKTRNEEGATSEKKETKEKQNRSFS